MPYLSRIKVWTILFCLLLPAVFASESRAANQRELVLIWFSNEPDTTHKKTMLDFDVDGVSRLPVPRGDKLQYSEVPLQVGLENMLTDALREPFIRDAKTKIRLFVISWRHKYPRENLREIIERFRGSAMIIALIPTTWRYEFRPYLSKLPVEIWRKDWPKLFDAGKVFAPFLFDLRYIVAYEQESPSGESLDPDPEEFVEDLENRSFSLPYLPKYDRDLLHETFAFFKWSSSIPKPFGQKNIKQYVRFLSAITGENNKGKPIRFELPMEEMQLSFLDSIQAGRQGGRLLTFASPYLLHQLVERAARGDLTDIDGFSFSFFPKYAFAGGSHLGCIYRDDEEKDIVASFLDALLRHSGKYASYTTLLPAMRDQLKDSLPLEVEKDSVGDLEYSRMKAVHDSILKVPEWAYSYSGNEYPESWLRSSKEDVLPELIRKGIETGDLRTLEKQLERELLHGRPFPLILIAPVAVGLLLLGFGIKKFIDVRHSKKLHTWLKGDREKRLFSNIAEIREVQIGNAELSDRDLCRSCVLLRKLDRAAKGSKIEVTKAEIVYNNIEVLLRWTSEKPLRLKRVEVISKEFFYYVAIDKVN